ALAVPLRIRELPNSQGVLAEHQFPIGVRIERAMRVYELELLVHRQLPARPRVSCAPNQLPAAKLLINRLIEWQRIFVRIPAHDRHLVWFGVADPHLRKSLQLEHLPKLRPTIRRLQVGFAGMVDDDFYTRETARHLLEHWHLMWRDVEIENRSQLFGFLPQRM